MYGTGRAKTRGLNFCPILRDDTMVEDFYFGSYSKTSIHQKMIQDKTRTKSYRNVMYHNKHLFRGKTVLDVGCGTGILSLFAARSGAKRVIGVDNSSIAFQARKIVLDNNYDEIITIIKGKVEEVELPVVQVDIIISEWMGFCLFYESMLDSVLFARDKWLVPGGLIFPDIVKLYLLGTNTSYDKYRDLQSLGDNYGFDLSALKELARKELVVGPVDPRCVVTSRFKVKEFNLQTDTKKDIEVDIDFSLTSTLKGTNSVTELTFYFDVIFSHCHKEVRFSTSPWSPTHWQQTTISLEQEYRLSSGHQLKARLNIM